MIKYEEKNTIEWFIIIIKTLFLMLFRFFTIWGLFILLLYYLGPLKKFQYSILYILITISLGAIYLVYINPKRLTSNCFLNISTSKYLMGPPSAIPALLIIHDK